MSNSSQNPADDRYRRPKTFMCWSGGKDSAFALWKILQEQEVEVCGLLTTVSLPYNRVSMHGVRRDLLEAQAESIGLPLHVVEVSDKTNSEYEEKMLAAFREFSENGITQIIFGDIFLEDLRNYRDALLARAGLKGNYPLWKKDTKELAGDFIRNNFQTLTCCVNDADLGETHCGKLFDEPFLKTLPEEVDPCGENGEFHTFCFDGPIFSKPVSFQKGELIYRPLEMKTADLQVKTKGFWYIDLIP